MRISDWSSDVCSSDLLAHQKLHQILVVALYAVVGAKAPHLDGTQFGVIAATPLGDIVEQGRHIQQPMPVEVGNQLAGQRSEERRVGKEWVSTCRSRW